MKDEMASIYKNYGCLVLILVVLLCIAVIFGIYCLNGWIFMLLWDWLAVSLFGAKALGY